VHPCLFWRNVNKSISLPDLLFALSGLVLGILVLITSLKIENISSYARVPPNLFPLLVGAGFVVVSLLLLVNVLRGDKAEPASEEDADPNAPTNYAAIGWISGGVMIQIFLLNPIGFILSSSLMFTCVASGFRTLTTEARVKRLGIDFLIGCTLSVVTYFGFTKGLGLSLPKGILPF
jgi:putative tricarboxylic transport membrane protein